VTAEEPRFFSTEIVERILLIAPSQRVAALTGVELAQERSAFLEKIRNSDIKGVVFDLGALQAFGSLMLGTLCLSWKQARDQGAPMVLCRVSATGRIVLERSKLSSVWPIFDSRELALDALRSANAGGIPLSAPETLPLGFEKFVRGHRLEVLELGPRTTIGFGGGELPPEHAFGRYLGEIYELIESSGCRELTLDLAGVSAVPSGFLGVLASVLKKGVTVSVKNASREVREALSLTNFDRLIKIV
jgi:anti-sigma B factor antagonist